MPQYTIRVDGQSHTIEADADMPLLYALRDDLGLPNPHFGCGLAQCGACTVHINGRAVRSCSTPVAQAAGQEIKTLNGLGTPANPHPVQTGVSGGAGSAVRVLHQRLDHDGGGLPGDQEEPDRCRDQRGVGRSQMPLRDPHGNHARCPSRRRLDGVRRNR